MKIIIKTPSKAYVEANQEELDSLRYSLTYTNTSASHDLKRLYSNHWFRNKNRQKWEEAIEQTKKRVKNTLIFEDENGLFITDNILSTTTPPGVLVSSTSLLTMSDPSNNDITDIIYYSNEQPYTISSGDTSSSLDTFPFSLDLFPSPFTDSFLDNLRAFISPWLQ